MVRSEELNLRRPDRLNSLSPLPAHVLKRYVSTSVHHLEVDKKRAWSKDNCIIRLGIYITQRSQPYCEKKKTISEKELAWPSA